MSGPNTCTHIGFEHVVIKDVPVADPKTKEFIGCFDRILCYGCGDYMEQLEVDGCTHQLVKGTVYNVD